MYPSLVLVQTRKTHPCISERLLMGRKESNQTKVRSYTIFKRLFIILVKLCTLLPIVLNKFSHVLTLY